MSHDGTGGLLIRPLQSAAEKRAAFALFRSAMLGLPDIGGADAEAEARYLEAGDGLGAFEGDALRAVTNGYASEVVLPGGARLPHLAVTHVGTAPGVNRRGYARALLSAQLRAAQAAGYPLAGLRASDARIYGRYGYGIASWSVRHDLDLTRTGLVTGAPDLPLRLVDPLVDLPLMRRIAEAAPSPRPAALKRWDAWWEMQAFRQRHSAGPFHAVVVGPPGAERGFLRFHTLADGPWFTASERRAEIDDFVAHDATTWRALIHYLASRDILHHVVFPTRPEDDPLPLLTDNPRALVISGRRDESWVRIIDVGLVLSRLALRDGSAIDLKVNDPILAENSRIWRIGTGYSGKVLRAEIETGDLASWVFGAASAAELQAAGRLYASDDVVYELDSRHPKGSKSHSGISF